MRPIGRFTNPCIVQVMSGREDMRRGPIGNEQMSSAYAAMGFVSVALFLSGWVTHRYAPAVGRNPWFGFATDWALATEDNWTRANRLAGQAFMMTAVTVVPTSLLFMQAIPQEVAP